MFKSFITFDLIPYHKNAFHDEFFLSVYSMLQKELKWTVAKKDVYQKKKKKQIVKKRQFSICKINFEFAKYTF